LHESNVWVGIIEFAEQRCDAMLSSISISIHTAGWLAGDVDFAVENGGIT